jgi:hypothetical protein
MKSTMNLINKYAGINAGIGIFKGIYPCSRNKANNFPPRKALTISLTIVPLIVHESLNNKDADY